MTYKNLTFNELEKLVSKYKDTEELRNDNKELYEFLLLDDAILNFKQLKFDKKLCCYYAQLCGSRNNLFKKNRKLYSTSLENNWLDEFFPDSIKKPAGYWDNKEHCAEVAKLCSSPTELQKKYKGAYKAIFRNGWTDIYPNSLKAPAGYWNNKEHCAEEAKKYKSRSEFTKNALAAYNYSLKNNWLDEFFPEYEFHHEKGYWEVKEHCVEEAKKYKSRTEFRENAQTAYSYSKKNGWLDEFFPITNNHRKTSIWENKENCTKEAKKYKSRSEFQKNAQTAYVHARKNGWLDEFFPKPEKKKKEEKKHQTINKEKTQPNNIKEKIENNKYYIENVTKELCAELIKQYKYKSELHHSNKELEQYIKYKNWIDDLFPESESKKKEKKQQNTIEEKIKNNKYYIDNLTKEQCVELVKQYKYEYTLHCSDKELYQYLKYKGWVEELFKDTKRRKFEYPEEWNDLEYCKKLLSEYKNREDVFNKNEALYRFAQRHKLLALVFDDFPKGWWLDKDHVREEAKKYKDITSFRNEHFSAYKNFTKWFKNGEIEDIFAEVRQQKPSNYWNNLEHCKDAAATCIDLLEFKHKYIAAWRHCNENNWLGELGLEENSNDINHEEREYVVYVYTDDINKVVYVGITTQKRIRKRHNEHNSKHYKRGYDSVKTYFNSINKELPAMQVVYNYLTVDEAMIKEDQTMKEYIANGWSILNKAPAGSKSSSIGGKNRYSKKYCTEIARKYKKESEFKKNDQFIYQKVIKYGWINEFDWIERDFSSTDSTTDSDNYSQTT